MEQSKIYKLLALTVIVSILISIGAFTLMKDNSSKIFKKEVEYYEDKCWIEIMNWNEVEYYSDFYDEIKFVSKIELRNKIDELIIEFNSWKELPGWDREYKPTIYIDDIRLVILLDTGGYLNETSRYITWKNK